MHTARRLTIALLVTAASVPAAARQTVPQRDAPATATQQTRMAAAPRTRLAGRITAAATGTPIRRALIAVTVDGRVVSRAFSQGDGGYEIDVPEGVPYAVVVTKSGYVAVTLPRPRTARSASTTLDLSLAAAAVLAGRVMDPLGNAVVSVRVRLEQLEAGPDGADIVTSTDDTGVFRVPGLTPGKYRVTTAGRPEYLTGSDQTLRLDPEARLRFSPPSSEPVTVELAAGELRDVTIAHRDPAVILPYANVGGLVSGQVSDESGEPVAGLSVQLWRIEVLNGIPVADRSGGARLTDDRGQYRLFHVRAGRYALVVTDDSNGSSSWLPVYYPGTTSPSQAMVLDIGRSQELLGIDMAFTHSQGARVFGIATNAAGEPLKNTVSLVAPDVDAAIVPAARLTSVDANGAFAFEAVPPGAYVLRATSSVSNVSLPPALLAASPTASINTISVPRDAEFAVQAVQVGDGDIGPIAFTTARPATLRGRIVFEGMEPLRTSFELTAFTTDPTYDISGRVGDGSVSRATINVTNWTFELPRVVGPIRLRLNAIPPRAWLKSADVGGINLAESPMTFLSVRDSRDDVVIVIAGTAGTVTGTVPDGAGVQVITFSTSRERWNLGSTYVQWGYADTAGRFTVASLPPGEYWVVAIDSVQNELLRRESERADFLESLTTSARRVTLGEGRTVSVSPRVVAMR